MMRTEWSGRSEEGAGLRYIQCDNRLGATLFRAEMRWRDSGYPDDVCEGLDGMTAGLRALCVPVWSGRTNGNDGWLCTLRNGVVWSEACFPASLLSGLTAFARWTAQPEPVVWSGGTVDGGTLGICRVVCYRGEPCGMPVAAAERVVGGIQSLARWLDTPDAEPEPVWSGTGWEPDSLGLPRGVVLCNGAPATSSNCPLWAYYQPLDVARAVQTFARWLSAPFVGWRQWHPAHPPRPGEPLLLLLDDGSVDVDEEGAPGWNLTWWQSQPCEQWRYLAEVLP